MDVFAMPAMSQAVEQRLTALVNADLKAMRDMIELALSEAINGGAEIIGGSGRPLDLGYVTRQVLAALGRDRAIVFNQDLPGQYVVALMMLAANLDGEPVDSLVGKFVLTPAAEDILASQAA